MLNQQGIKPKILVFSLTYLPFIGGAEVAIQEIAKRLGEDFKFDLITLNLDGQQKAKEIIDGMTVYRVKHKYLYPWLAFKKAKELHKQGNYQIVWGIMATWGGWAALKFKEKFPDVKYLLTLQSGDSDKFIKNRTWFWSWRYKKIYQRADCIQVISKWLEDRARKFGYTKEIQVVPNGVDVNKFKVQGEKLKVNENSKNILTVSRLVEKNGVEDLIRAFQIIVTKFTQYKSIKLIVVGTGPLADSLKDLVQELGIKDNVDFVGDVKYDELPNYYARADVFVRPSLSEGFGNAFVEAMAMNVPVIGTPVGGIPDFLKDGETGLFCKVNDPQDLANKIELILKDENLRNKIVNNAKKMVEEKYTWDIVAEKMKKIFNDLI